MSLYADYLSERTTDLIIESDYGFATFRYLDGGVVYIVDLYVIPEVRKQKHAAGMADFITKQAKRLGCTELIGTVVPSTKGANASMRVLLAYGMTVKTASHDLIVFRKEI